MRRPNRDKLAMGILNKQVSAAFSAFCIDPLPSNSYIRHPLLRDGVTFVFLEAYMLTPWRITARVDLWEDYYCDKHRVAEFDSRDSLRVIARRVLRLLRGLWQEPLPYYDDETVLIMVKLTLLGKLCGEL